VTALVWLALKLTPRGTVSNNAATRHAIWWATLAVVLVLPAAPRVIRAMRPHPQPIKPNNSGDARVSGGFQPGVRYRVTNCTLRADCRGIRQTSGESGLSDRGGPKWIDSDRFDVDAKALGDFPPGPDGPSAPRRVMLQALLADRFRLEVHHEIRQGSVYALLFAKADRAALHGSAPEA